MQRIAALISALALVFMSVAMVSAQDASPSAGSPTADESLLAGLGYPEIVIATDGLDFDSPADVAAGRYRIVVENTSDGRSADIEIYQVPEGMTFDDLVVAFEEIDPEAETAPDIFYEVGIAGGATASPGQTGDVVVDLTPGEWALNLYSQGGEGEEETNLPKLLTVTGEMPALEDPVSDVEVTMVDLAFEMPDMVPAGPAIWQVTNTGAYPHFMAIERYPEPITAEQVQATLDMAFGMPSTPLATPVELLNPDLFEQAGGSLVLSTGMTNWIEVNLEPGQYVVLCFVSGPGDLPPHAAAGMYKIITVE